MGVHLPDGADDSGRACPVQGLQRQVQQGCFPLRWQDSCSYLCVPHQLSPCREARKRL